LNKLEEIKKQSDKLEKERDSHLKNISDIENLSNCTSLDNVDTIKK